MAIEAGTAQGGTIDTIRLSPSASSVNDFYKWRSIKIISGTGAGQAQVIKDYDGSTKKATFYLPWTTVNHLSWVVPDNTSVYEIIGQATISEVALWVKYEDNEWQDTGLRSSGTSGSFSYTPDQGSGTYYFATQAFDSQGNSSLPPVGPGSSQIQYISSVTSNLSESYLTNLFQQTLANPFMILSEGLR